MNRGCLFLGLSPLPGGLASVRAATTVLPPSPTPVPEADQLRGIVPPVRLTDWLADHFWLLTGLAAVALVALVAWLLWRRHRRRRVPGGDPRTPRQRADDRLRQLRVRAETLDARTFGDEACDILRDFLAAERRLPIARQTSEEFLTAAAAGRAVSPGEHALLAEFLTTCDGLKFARADATAEVKEHLLVQAADFVDGTAASRPPPLPASATA